MRNLPAHRVGEVARCEHIEFPFSRAIYRDCAPSWDLIVSGTILYSHWNCIKDRFDRFDLA